ncbi:two pore calcium channel protein 1-like isoform X2 [Ctenocephalides felis]|uniref:two pore calcium channel protein 1-like isoform X2 n=1 Tax=Ctenocephalides felis TaxID=7515 RepID=UPI000E6E12CF|nr:two pore calcium channel protein 1-like isoform X2 [Ctenocephalides felis]
MASIRGPLTPPDGYSRFNNEINNPTVSYGSSNINLPLNGDTSTMGSRSSLNRDLTGCENDSDYWEMNYHEAAIYLEEGRRNEKFDAHPRHVSALPAYKLVHSTWYHLVDLSAAIALLVLAVAEEPAAERFRVPIAVHGVLELLNLTVIGVMLFLKLRWIGWKSILNHKRTMIKGITLGVMIIEALVVILRSTSHFRVTRAFRPMFLVDTRACGGVRRFVRQVLQSMPPILDMLGLLLFFITTYTLVGYLLFSSHIDPRHFGSLGDSFVSMFVLLTTANYPDVMMPAYSYSWWYAIFFVSYLAIVLYVLMNLMLAVVYEAFTRIERDKFKALLLHKKRACELALPLLQEKNGNGIKFEHFKGVMRYYAPYKRPLEVLLMFLSLNTSNTGLLSPKEWLGVYEACMLHWKRQGDSLPWFYTAAKPLRIIGELAQNIVKRNLFEIVIYCLLVLNGLCMIFQLWRGVELLNSGQATIEDVATYFAADVDSAIFLAIFTLEGMIRMLALGSNVYFASGWNVFDFFVTILGVMGALFMRLDPSLVALAVLRPLRLMRLYKLKKRYRDVFGTLVLLSPLMCSAALVMLVLYYFYAIIGMELFAGYDMRNCCVNTSVEDFFKYSANSSTPLGYYYLNTFDNILSSSLTLFELTVVNNWFILMDGYASVAGQPSRLFFMLFYLSTMIVLTIVVASVLEAFRFRIQYKRSTSKREEEKMLHVEVHVTWSRLAGLLTYPPVLTELDDTNNAQNNTTTFTGSRPRTREVFQRRMYSTEIKQWLEDTQMNHLNDIQQNAAPNETIEQPRHQPTDTARLIGTQ